MEKRYMKKFKVYMAGPLFSEADQKQRKHEADALKSRLLDEFNLIEGEDYEIFAPIYAPVNNKSTLPTAEDIFLADRRELLTSNVIMADLSHYDAGVMMELGMVIEDPDVIIIAYDSDLRASTAGNYEGLRIPYGVNQFVIGGLLDKGSSLVSSWDLAYDELIKKLKLK